MNGLRIQEMTPEVYCRQSRDFQVFCRAFDVILNGLKFDVDSIKKLTDTDYCRNTFLPLLQTKLGFFTQHEFNSDTLRYILGAFPLLVKYKGSLKAIKGAIYTYVKALGIEPEVRIWYTKEEIKQDYITIKDNSVIIGIEGKLQDIDILIEVFKYILPIGVHYYFFFFTNETSEDTFIFSDKATLIYVSDKTNSRIRSSSDVVEEE